MTTASRTNIRKPRAERRTLDRCSGEARYCSTFCWSGAQSAGHGRPPLSMRVGHSRQTGGLITSGSSEADHPLPTRAVMPPVRAHAFQRAVVDVLFSRRPQGWYQPVVSSSAPPRRGKRRSFRLSRLMPATAMLRHLVGQQRPAQQGTEGPRCVPHCTRVTGAVGAGGRPSVPGRAVPPLPPVPGSARCPGAHADSFHPPAHRPTPASNRMLRRRLAQEFGAPEERRAPGAKVDRPSIASASLGAGIRWAAGRAY